MIALAIDSSGRFCSACIFDAAKQQILAQINEDIGRGHDQRLMRVIGQCMLDAKVEYSALERIVASIGPGSFTGIRVGVATARGLGLGLQIPVIGVSCLDALLFQLTNGEAANKTPPTTRLGAVMPAGRGEIYCQFSVDSELAKANVPFVASVEQLAGSVLLREPGLRLCGEAATLIKQRAGLDIVVAPQPFLSLISAIAQLGTLRQPDGSRPEPLYLRKPDAKPQQGFAVERAG